MGGLIEALANSEWRRALRQRREFSSAPDIGPQTVQITRDYVRQRLADLAADEELSNYIL